MIKSIADFLLNSNPLSIEMISILIVVGFIVGFINTLAGMASALSYALFMAMGMPINVANGTTRVGIILQFAASSFLFKKKGLIDVKLASKVAVPIAVGSIAGANLAALVNTQIMEVVMGIMLPCMAILLIYNHRIENSGKTKNPYRCEPGRFGPLQFTLFFVIGAYGGFTHAGVGILIIFGSFYFLGLDMLRSNGIKQFAVLLYTPIALAIFIWHGQINWPVALIYSIGNVSGAVVASRFAFKWGAILVNYMVAAAVFMMSFWLIYKQFT